MKKTMSTRHGEHRPTDTATTIEQLINAYNPGVDDSVWRLELKITILRLFQQIQKAFRFIQVFVHYFASVKSRP